MGAGDDVPEAYRSDRPIQKIVSRVGRRLILGHTDSSPIEHVLRHLSARPHLHCEGAQSDPQWAALMPDTREVRAFLERQDLHQPGELLYVTLRAAACFEDMLAEYLDHAERHIWRWLSQRDDMAPEDIPIYAYEQLERHFRHFRERVEMDVARMEELVTGPRITTDELLRRCAQMQDWYDTESRRFDAIGFFITEHEWMAAAVADLRLTPDEKTLLAEDTASPLNNLFTVLLREVQPQESILRAFQRVIERAVGRPAREPVPRPVPAPAPSPLPAAATRRTRRAIKRATKLFDRLGFMAELRAFVAGDTVEIAHPASPFVFRARRHSDAGRGIVAFSAEAWRTVPFRLSLSTKDGTHLARLCTYAESTPILDFLLALFLHVRAGEEMTVLQQANWFGYGERAPVQEFLLQAHPELVEKLPLYLVPKEMMPSQVNDYEEWMAHEERPFLLERYSSVVSARPLAWNRADWAWCDEAEGLEDEFYYDPQRWDRHQRTVQLAAGAWLGAVIGKWAALREPLEELVAMSDIARHNPDQLPPEPTMAIEPPAGAHALVA